jgi:mono/diheme cytochrome c family protein
VGANCSAVGNAQRRRGYVTSMTALNDLRRPTRAGFLAVVTLGVLGGCAPAADGPDDPLAERGRTLFTGPLEGGNTFACETCHATTEPAANGLRRPGHPLADATRRPTYKNGQLSSFLDAVNTCLVEWMNAEPWTDDDDDFQALHAFLDSLAPSATAPALSFRIVAPPAELEGGDPSRGRATFNESCSVCHGDDGLGTERGPAVSNRGLEADLVARRVRTSGRGDSSVYDGLSGGIMPFWAEDRLSDAELRDLVAWLATPPADDPPPGGSGTGGDPGPSSDCPQTHPRVGQSATLVGQSHGVAGIVEIVDDCTLVLREFDYDGAGIDVRVYGGLGGDYHGGFAISDDLLRAGGYQDAELTLTLPEDRTLDDLDGVSIWCVTVGVDFGSGTFE